jgi:hypothetical protein
VTAVKPDAFSEAAKQYFSFLADEDFVGPVEDKNRLLYSFAVEVLHEIARSGHSMNLALQSQASVLRELLPLLSQAEASALLLKCHGR